MKKYYYRKLRRFCRDNRDDLELILGFLASFSIVALMYSLCIIGAILGGM